MLSEEPIRNRRSACVWDITDKIHCESTFSNTSVNTSKSLPEHAYIPIKKIQSCRECSRHILMLRKKTQLCSAPIYGITITPYTYNYKTLQCWGFRRQNTITILSKKANYEDFCWLQQKSNTVSAGSPNWWTQPPKREKTHCFDMLRSDILHNSLALTDKFSTHFASRLGFDMLDKSWSWTGNFSGNNCCTAAGTS